MAAGLAPRSRRREQPIRVEKRPERLTSVSTAINLNMFKGSNRGDVRLLGLPALAYLPLILIVLCWSIFLAFAVRTWGRKGWFTLLTAPFIPVAWLGVMVLVAVEPAKLPTNVQASEPMSLTTTQNWLWLALYVAIFLLLIAGFGIITAFAWRSFRPNSDDSNYIRLHRETLGSSSVNIRRISSFSRIRLGGTFALTNWARMYVVESISPHGRAERFNYAIDPITGQRKMRSNGMWREV